MEINLATINIWGLPWPLSRQRGRRLARLHRWLQAAELDLVGLQEVWWPRPTLSLRGLRLPQSGRDTGLGFAGGLSGDGPLDLHHFEAAAGVDAFKAKGLLSVQLDVAQVGVTHLQAGERHAAVRRDQVTELIERIGDGPAVVMGDFNFYAGLDDHSEADLSAAGFRDVALDRPEATFLPRNPFAVTSAPHRFDRIYVRDGDAHRFEVDEVAVLPRVVSDHQPVQARLRLVAA